MVDDDIGSVVAQIAERHGWRSVESRLVRSGANEVSVVEEKLIRISRADVDVDRHLAIGRVLYESGVPVPEPIVSGKLGGHPYSVWEYVESDESATIDFYEFGVGIRTLHTIDLGGIDLPGCDEPDWLDITENLVLAREAGVVSSAGIDILEAHAERLRLWGERCRSADRQVVCHGDVHPQNVVMRDGKAIIVDWDTICVGPPQWDHSALLTWADRWGGRSEDYQGFAAGYGESFAGDSLAIELAEIRLLAPTVNMILKGRNDSHAAAEANLRMQYWRQEPEAPAWTPH